MSRVEEIREVVETVVEETVVDGEHNNVYRNLCKTMKAYSVEELTEYCIAMGEAGTLHAYLTQHILDMAVVKKVWGKKGALA